MAEIREVLRLVDDFSGNMNAYLRAAQNASACNRQLQNNVRRVAAQMASQSAVMRAAAGAVSAQGAAAGAARNGNTANANALRMSAGAANVQNTAVRAATAQSIANANTVAMQTNAVNRQGNAFNAASNLVRRQTAAVRDNTAAVNAAVTALEQHNRMQARVQIAADVARAEQRRQQQQMDASRSSANSLSGALSRLGGIYFGLRSISGIGSISDELISAEARLNLINDGLQTTAELQGMIYRAAERSRGSYAAMSATVSKLGILAGDAFDSTQEMIAFTELLNKNFIIGGAAAEEQTAAMYQLTQAMASGRLQGDEYRSIIENAPLLAQAIEDYMRNVQNAKGTMKDWASAGLLTADVIKAAMFNAADEVEERFATMPATWAQAWQQAKNLSIEIFQPVLNAVGKTADFVNRNIEVVVGGFYGLTIAVGGYTVAQWAANDAAKAFVLGILKSPLLPVAAAFIAIGAAVGLFIKHCGSAKAAWLTFVDVSLTAGQNLWIGLVSIFYHVQNKFDETGLRFAVMSTNISNGFGDLKVSVLKHLQDLVNGGIGYVNRFIGVLNKIPGVNIAPIEAAAFGDNAAEKNNASKAKRAANLADITAQTANNAAERAGNISAMKLARDTARAARLQGIEEAKAEAAGFGDYSRFSGSWGDMANNLSSIAGDTKAIKNSVDLTDETMKMLVDMAERRYVNNINLTTQSPVIQISGQNTGDSKEDRRRLVNMLRDALLEEMSAGATRSTVIV